ncbi:MAG: YdcF family protein, partial [Acetobacteraceae bacterium]|nr:YdcF family protein [Acetobacteraceae bacterium]
AERLLVSGVHPDVTLADLAGMAAQPVDALRGRVTLGQVARSTRGNAVEAAAWARAEALRSVRVVTAGYHMPRALVEIGREIQPEVELVPHPVLPAGLRDAGAASRPRTWTLLAGEYLKLVGAVLGLAPADGA